MKNRIVKVSFAAALILICFIPAIIFFSKKKTAEYEIVCFGDSVMAGYYSTDTVPACIKKMTGRPVLNAAFGGLSMSKPYEIPKEGDTSNFYSMAELSEALLNRDFSLQIMGTKLRVEEFEKKWPAVADKLNKLDYNSVKYIIIEHGVNDYLMGKRIDDDANPYNIYTFAGALRTSIENVKKAIPNATIVLVTPTYMQLDSMDKDCFETDFGGGTLPDYVAKEKEVAAEYGLICVDDFYESGIDKDNYEEYLFDGLHTLYEANLLIADNIVRNVEGICKDDITR